MISIITSFIRKCGRCFFEYSSKNHFNLLATLFFNYYYLPLSQSIKLPIYIYGWPKFISLGGSIIISSPIARGMIKLNRTGHNSYPSIRAEYVNDGGCLEFCGPCELNSGFRILVYNKGIIKFGKNFEAYCLILGCQKRIDFGDNVLIGGGSIIYDTDFHYVYNSNKEVISSGNKPVIIGNNVWIGTESYISKDVVIPDNSIVSARSSLIAKYSNDFEPGALIAGNPAKIHGCGYKRLDGMVVEYLSQHFSSSDEDIHISKDLLINHPEKVLIL